MHWLQVISLARSSLSKTLFVLKRGERKTRPIGQPQDSKNFPFQQRYVIGPKATNQSEKPTKYAISAEILERCLEPINQLYNRAPIRVVVRLP
jgi:hypothetical protein